MSARTEPTPADPQWVVVGRVGRAHGLRGDVAVEVRTDAPEVRFAPGSQLLTDRPGGQDMTVAAATWHSGRLLVRFEGVADRTAAEALRGILLRAQVLPDESPDDPEEFYDRQLLGLRVVDLSGACLGTVTDVLHLPGHDLLAVRTADSPSGGTGEEVLVPFVAQIVVAVDVAVGTVRVDPPGGLFGPPSIDEDADGA